MKDIEKLKNKLNTLVIEKHLEKSKLLNVKKFKVIERIISTNGGGVKMTCKYKFKDAYFSIQIFVSKESVDICYDINGQNLTDEILEISKFLNHFSYT